jgi:hypothetical protein
MPERVPLGPVMNGSEFFLTMGLVFRKARCLPLLVIFISSALFVARLGKIFSL